MRIGSENTAGPVTSASSSPEDEVSIVKKKFGGLIVCVSSSSCSLFPIISRQADGLQITFESAYFCKNYFNPNDINPELQSCHHQPPIQTPVHWLWAGFPVSGPSFLYNGRDPVAAAAAIQP